MTETNLTLFDRDDPRPPSNGTPTSNAAAESIVPHVDRLEQLVLKTLRELDGATCDRVEVVTELSHQTCSARFSELKKRGLIQKTGERHRTRSGRMAEVWEAV